MNTHKHQAPKLDDARTLALITQGASVDEILASLESKQASSLDDWTLAMIRLYTVAM